MCLGRDYDLNQVDGMVIMGSSTASGLFTHLRCDSEVSEPRDRVHAKEGITILDWRWGNLGMGIVRKAGIYPFNLQLRRFLGLRIKQGLGRD